MRESESGKSGENLKESNNFYILEYMTQAKFKIGDVVRLNYRSEVGLRLVLRYACRKAKGNLSLCSYGVVVDVVDCMCGYTKRKNYEVLFNTRVNGRVKKEWLYSYQIEPAKLPNFTQEMLRSQAECHMSPPEDEPKMVANRVRTPDGTILWSRFTHDCVRYQDKVSNEEYMLDGGNDYRRCYVNQVPAVNMVVTDRDPWEKQREVILRGTFNLNKSERRWVPIAKLSNAHIIALVEMYGEKSNYKRELVYRQQNNIDIPEHPYDDEGVESITPQEKQQS